MKTKLNSLELAEKTNNPNQPKNQPDKAELPKLTEKEIELEEIKKKLAKERKALNEEKRNLGID